MTEEEASSLARRTLSGERYYHTSRVVEAAGALAGRYGADAALARTAAWLHDICKEEDQKLLLQRLLGDDILRDGTVQRNHALLHSYAGGRFVKDVLGLDSEIADAVMYHTAGRAGMSLLEKVVFLADYISDDRDFPGLEEVREAAEKSLNAACVLALRNTIIHICKQQRVIDLNSVRAFNDLIGDMSI